MRNKLLFLALPLLFGLQASAQHTQAFQDTTLTDEQRVEHLLSILTLDEKINLLSTDLGVPRLNIPRCGHYEGLSRLPFFGVRPTWQARRGSARAVLRSVRNGEC